MPANAIKLPAALERFVAPQVREGTYRSREALSVAVAADLPLAPVGLGADVE
jgi:hypothetical protein